MNLSTGIAAIAGVACLAAAPARAFCDYPVAHGGPVARAAAFSFMQIPFAAPERAAAVAETGQSCRTDQGSRVLPLGPSTLGYACGFRLPDGSFAEGVVGR